VTTTAVTLLQGNLFGPQSQWSSLLNQREHLQIEITRGRKHLERLRKDLAECGALVHSLPAREEIPQRHSQVARARSLTGMDSMEDMLSAWLHQLEQMLEAVNRDIEGFEMKNRTEPLDPEGSLFALLRAAG
jgi:hypothetical protein